MICMHTGRIQSCVCYMLSHVNFIICRFPHVGGSSGSTLVAASNPVVPGETSGTMIPSPEPASSPVVHDEVSSSLSPTTMTPPPKHVAAPLFTPQPMDDARPNLIIHMAHM